MPKLIIERGRTERNYWRDLWRYRELFYFLAWRDILVRYKQTVIGIMWAILKPFLTVVVFSLFGKMVGTHVPGDIPRPLFVSAAVLPWTFFSTALSESSNSLISNANLISKIYFPRLIVPAGSVITSFVDFLITLGMMGILMLCFGFPPDWHLFALPFFVALAFCASFGIGLWLCALNVEYRDFRYIVPFITQFGLYISPIPLSTSSVPIVWFWHGCEIPVRFLYSLNPMVGVIDGFRWTLLRGQSDFWWPSILTSIALTAFLCFSGIWYFRKMEKTFADVI
jgi:lipopolysaccharide transport system permease protein